MPPETIVTARGELCRITVRRVAPLHAELRPGGTTVCSLSGGLHACVVKYVTYPRAASPRRRHESAIRLPSIREQSLVHRTLPEVMLAEQAWRL